MRVAIIDLGSNSARMNIVEINGDKTEILQNHRKVVRLSEGMGDEKMLQPRAVERTLEVLKEFKNIIDECGVEHVRAVATAALRTAVNKELITEPLKDIGIEFEIISGEKEAYYDYMAVVNTLDVKNCMIIDIGGASTELIYVKDGINVNMLSLPMAAVNITEKYFSGSTASDDEFNTAVGIFTDMLGKHEWLGSIKGVDCVGLGGTIRGLAKIQCKGEDLHGYTMNRDFVFEKAFELIKTPLQKRILMDGIGKGRADIILGGVVPLIAVMRYIDSPKLITCVSGLREGVMYDIIKK